MSLVPLHLSLLCPVSSLSSQLTPPISTFLLSSQPSFSSRTALFSSPSFVSFPGSYFLFSLLPIPSPLVASNHRPLSSHFLCLCLVFTSCFCSLDLVEVPSRALFLVPVYLQFLSDLTSFVVTSRLVPALFSFTSWANFLFFLSLFSSSSHFVAFR